MKKKGIIAGLLLILSAAVLWSQSDLATINGQVKDASGAVVPGVQVTVTNTGTNEVRVLSTSDTGLYSVPDLPVGTYRLSFAKAGFKTFERRGLILAVSQVAEINVVLAMGAVSEVVEVTSAPPVLQTEDSTVSSNLNNQAVSELPLNVSGSRNLSNFMFAYVPGVEGSDYSSHIDGSMALSKEVMIDGTSAVSQLGGYISESQPPMEAVQEFEVDTAGISADAGRTGGGVFRYEMKSGTNTIHGSLFGFMHSTGLDALSAANRLAVITDPANASAYLRKSDTLSDWGGSFGGPLVKSKLFYYVSFERYMQDIWSLGPNTRTVPTDAMMGLNSDGSVAQYADLSAMLSPSVPVLTYGGAPAVDNCGNPIYQGAIVNPATETGSNFGCVFVNNQIPTNMISATTAKILQLYHSYYQPESQLNANNAGPSYNPDPWFHNTQTSVKLDYNLSDKNHIDGSFYYDNYPRINADQGGAWSATAPDGGPLANSYWHNTTAPSVRLTDSYFVRGNLINTAHFTLNRFRNPSIAVSQKTGWDQTLGITDGAGNFPLTVFSSGMYTNGGNYQNGWNFSNIGSQYNDFYAANTYIYNDEVDWTHGRHTYKFGAEFRAMQFNSHPDSFTFNNVTFDPTSTAGPWYDFNAYNKLGNAFASFLLGDVYLATETAVDPQYGRRKAFSLYGMDDFKVNARLTLNLSLRWDYNNPYKEKYGHWSSYILNAMNPVSNEMGEYQYLSNGSQSFEKRQDWFNFAPHIGAAYKITDKTVARGNFAVFYVPLNLNTWGGIPYQQTGNPGYYQHSTESNFSWDAGYHPTLSEVKTPDYTQWGVVGIDPRALTPGNTQQWNVGVQRELAKDTKVDVSWIQSHSCHLQSGTLLTNQPTVANMQAYVSNGTFPASYNGYWGYGGTGPGWQGITPYPQIAVAYGPLFSVGSPLGNSDYKSLQISATKRTAHGLSLLGSYNWSRAHGDVDSSFNELWWAGDLQNVYDLRDEAKDISDFDMTHIVKGYVIYELPFGHGKTFLSGTSGAVNQIVGGWSLNGDFHYNTGTPVSVHSANSYPGFNSVYIDLVPGCKLTNGSPALNKQWLNPSCFQNPDGATGQLGTGGNFQAGIRNPGLASEDVGLHKSVAMGTDGRYSLTFRMEFFNVFNRHQLAGPDTGLNDYTATGVPLFGKIDSYTGFGGRVGQFGARLNF